MSSFFEPNSNPPDSGSEPERSNDLSRSQFSEKNRLYAANEELISSADLNRNLKELSSEFPNWTPSAEAKLVVKLFQDTAEELNRKRQRGPLSSSNEQMSAKEMIVIELFGNGITQLIANVVRDGNGYTSHETLSSLYKTTAAFTVFKNNQDMLLSLFQEFKQLTHEQDRKMLLENLVTYKQIIGSLCRISTNVEGRSAVLAQDCFPLQDKESLLPPLQSPPNHNSL